MIAHPLRDFWTMALVVIALPGCGNASSESDGMGGAGGAAAACETNDDCQDGVFCNGREQCNGGQCEAGDEPRCDDGIACTLDTCSHLQNNCLFHAPDRDGDGHADALCLGPDGESLGDDCDDDDPNRYPGNAEVCSPSDVRHDEDCNPDTFGRLDLDQDGEVSAECCNEDSSGQDHCGSDCDDSDPRRFSEHPEICDDLDNDCDGEVDTNTREVDWYPDADGDQYGVDDGNSVSSCAPVEGHSLRPTDCDDTRASVHPAAPDVCNAIDDDCDGTIDEEDVCSCSPEGDTRACACAPQINGSQTCAQGEWSDCDCSECVSGVKECLGSLLPRTCENGRWVVGAACSGVRPVCLSGECVCADGSQNCEDIADVVPPTVVDSFPSDGSVGIAAESTLSVVFSEAMAGTSFDVDSVTLRDSLGNLVSGVLALGGQTVSFSPSSPLFPGMDYTLTVDEGVQDLAGNGLGLSHTVDFTTHLQLSPTLLDDSPSVAYQQAQLAMSPLGRAEIVTFQAVTAGDTVSLEPGYFAYQAGDFVAMTPPSGFLTSFDLALDDQGTTLLFTNSGNTVSLQRAIDGVWPSPESIGVSSQLTIGAAPQANSAGAFLFAYPVDASQLEYIASDDATGAWLTQTVSQVSAPAYFATDLNEASRGSLVVDKNGGTTLSGFLFASDFADVVEHSRDAGMGEQFIDADIALSEDGVATIAWEETVFGAESYIQSRVRIQDVSSDGFVGSPVELPEYDSLRREGTPRVGVDEDGAVHVAALLEQTGLVATRRAPGATSWGTEQRINALDSGVVSYELHVSASGDALLVWTQQDDSVDLFASLYSGASGWGPPRRLEDFSADVQSMSAAMDGLGSARIVFICSDQLFAVSL